MKKRNYIIVAHGVIERGNNHRYLYNKGYKEDILDNKEDIIYDTRSIFISMKDKDIEGMV